MQNRRLVKATKSMVTGTVVFVLISILVLGIYGGNNAVNLSQVNLLRQEGKSITGDVTDTHVVHGKGTTYVVGYSYDVAGQSYEFSDDVNPSEYDNYTVGQPISLTYAASNPNVHRRGPVGDAQVQSGQWLLWGGLSVIATVAVIILGIVIACYKWQYSLLSKGITAPATILANDKIPNDRTGMHKVSYEFKDNKGIELTRTTNVNANRSYEVPVGGTTAAYYMPSSPEKSRIPQELNMAQPAN